MSPYLEKCCLLVSANVSYANAEQDITILTGIVVSGKTQQRLVQRFDFPPHQAKEPIQELGVDGGKVRLRTPLKEASIWRDYKALETDQGVVAALHNNAQLIDWVNRQSLNNPLICLGDGHDGIWNIIQQIGLPEQRREILDWYHLNENLQKVGGSLKRLKQAETLLWNGQLEETIALFAPLKSSQAQNFCLYLDKLSIVLGLSITITTRRKGLLQLVQGPLNQPLKVIPKKEITIYAGWMRISHLGKSGLRESRSSISVISRLSSEMPLR
jgi:hypothetical protein